MIAARFFVDIIRISLVVCEINCNFADDEETFIAFICQRIKVE